VFAWFVFYIPNYLLAPDNFIPANPEHTPTHIAPEWYCLLFIFFATVIGLGYLGSVRTN